MMEIILGCLVSNIITFIIIVGIGFYLYKKNQDNIKSMIELMDELLNTFNLTINKVNNVTDLVEDNINDISNVINTTNEKLDEITNVVNDLKKIIDKLPFK